MGEYYNWVNVDRKEYICPSDFDYGNKKHESMVRGNVFLCALRELISKEWAGDHVIFLGDEKSISEGTDNETLEIMYKHMLQEGYPEDTMMIEIYKNISGLFKAAEQEVRQEIHYYIEELKSHNSIVWNEYGVDISNPYEGLFLRIGLDFKYTINHTKRVCYSFDKTRILHLDNTENNNLDPLPVLMGYGRVSETGAWVGDIIGVADEIPKGYELLKEIYLDR